MPKKPSKKTSPRTTQAGRLAVLVLVGLAALLMLGEIFIHRHAYFALEARPVFYGIYGFFAFLLVVGGGVLLRLLVMRPPDYYDPAPAKKPPAKKERSRKNAK